MPRKSTRLSFTVLDSDTLEIISEKYPKIMEVLNTHGGELHKNTHAILEALFKSHVLTREKNNSPTLDATLDEAIAYCLSCSAFNSESDSAFHNIIMYMNDVKILTLGNLKKITTDSINVMMFACLLSALHELSLLNINTFNKLIENSRNIANIISTISKIDHADGAYEIRKDAFIWNIVFNEQISGGALLEIAKYICSLAEQKLLDEQVVRVIFEGLQRELNHSRSAMLFLNSLAPIFSSYLLFKALQKTNLLTLNNIDLFNSISLSSKRTELMATAVLCSGAEGFGLLNQETLLFLIKNLTEIGCIFKYIAKVYPADVSDKVNLSDEEYSFWRVFLNPSLDYEDIVSIASYLRHMEMFGQLKKSEIKVFFTDLSARIAQGKSVSDFVATKGIAFQPRLFLNVRLGSQGCAPPNGSTVVDKITILPRS
jgi:hypothetical protein